MPDDRECPMFTFERLKEQAKRGDNVEALFMWEALKVATSAPGYTHLTLKETFEYLRTTTQPQQETDEDTFNSCDVANRYYNY